jgi:hypothetical protein
MCIRFHTEENAISVTLEASWVGGDLNISIFGGDKGHIGAVAVAQARPSLADPAVTSASTSVITLVGHKEDRIACKVAEKVAIEINGVASVACGIHVNQASTEQINTICHAVDHLLEQLLRQIHSSK